MEIDLERKPLHNVDKLKAGRFEAVEAFSDEVRKKYDRLIVSALVSRPGSDEVRLHFIVDDLNNVVFDQHVADMELDVSEMAYASSLPLKCVFIIASLFWKRFNERDDDILDLVRDSLVVHDKGFFRPVQDLLVTGKVRPSKESVQVYFVKAERSMKNSTSHVGKAVLDLYWAVMDAAHAAVMVAGETPPSPKDVAGTVKRVLVARNLVHERCGEIVESFYDIAKRLMHREIFDISGRDYDSYLDDADFFIREVEDFVREHAK